MEVSWRVAAVMLGQVAAVMLGQVAAVMLGQVATSATEANTYEETFTHPVEGMVAP